MRNVIPLFSTPLFITEVTPVSDEIKKYISNVPYSKHDSNIKLSDEKHILDQPILKPLRDEILREFNYYVNDVLQIDSQDLTWELTTSWTTKSDPGDSSDVHNHRNSLISGVVYLETNPESGTITFNEFNNNRLFYQMIDLKFKSFNIYNSSLWGVPPENYMMIFFPSVLFHQVAKNMSNQVRHSLAFNFFPKGKLGDYLSELEIK
jgi:uncharacterized protein (TIGR02466 family)